MHTHIDRLCQAAKREHACRELSEALSARSRNRHQAKIITSYFTDSGILWGRIVVSFLRRRSASIFVKRSAYRLGRRVNRHYFVLITAALMFAIGGIAGYLHHRHSVDEAVQKEEVALEAEDAQEQQQVQPADPPAVQSKIGKNENFAAALQHAGFNTADRSGE